MVGRGSRPSRVAGAARRRRKVSGAPERDDQGEIRDTGDGLILRFWHGARGTPRL
jgi:hypothetical protein